MFKTSKLFGGLLAVGALAVMIGGGVSASAAPNPGPGDSTTNNISGNATSVSDPTMVYEAVGSNPATAKSTAEFKVEGGRLLLIAVPDLNFGTVEGNIILGGGEKKLVDNTVVSRKMSKDVTAFDGNNVGKLVVSDGRGATGTWQLQLAMNSTFTAGSEGSPVATGATIQGVLLDVHATPTNTNPGHVISNLEGLNIGNTAATIVTATNGAGKTEFDITGEDNARLIFTGGLNSDFNTDEPYQSDLTWTLVAGA